MRRYTMFILLWTLLFPICAFSQESKESPKESQRLEAQHQTIELAHSYLHSLNNKETPLLIQEKKQQLKAIWSQQKISPLWLDAQWNSYFILVLHSILQRYQRALMESPFSEENDAKLFSLYSQILKKIAAYDTPLKILYGDIETLLKNHGRGSSSFQKMKDISQALEGHEWNLSQYKRAVKNRGWIENYFESVGDKNQDDIEGYWKNAMSWRQIIKKLGVPSDVMEALLEEEKKINKEAAELLEEDRSQVKWVYAGAVALPLLILASKAAIVTGAVVGMSSKASVGLMVGVPLALGGAKGLGHFIYNGARDSRHIEVSHFLNELIPELTYALPWAVVGPFLGVGVVKTALKDIARPIFYTLAGGAATSATVCGIRGYEQIENGEVDKGAILLMDSAIDLAAIVGVVAYVNLPGSTKNNGGGGSSLKLKTPSPKISPQPHGHGAPPSPHETIHPATTTKTFRVQGTEPTGPKAIGKIETPIAVMEKEPKGLNPQMSVEEMNWAYQNSISKEPTYPSMGPSIELPSPKPLPMLPVQAVRKYCHPGSAKPRVAKCYPGSTSDGVLDPSFRWDDNVKSGNDKSTAPQTGFETPDDGMEDVEIVRRDDDGKVISRRIVRVKKGSTEKEIWEAVGSRTVNDKIVGAREKKGDENADSPHDKMPLEIKNSDEDMRGLEKAVQVSPDDTALRRRLILAKERAGAIRDVVRLFCEGVEYNDPDLSVKGPMALSYYYELLDQSRSENRVDTELQNFWPTLAMTPGIDSYIDNLRNRALQRGLTPEIVRDIFQRAEPYAFQFIEIRPGKFGMGSPREEQDRIANERLHGVEITKPFFIKRTSVTQGEYFLATGTNPSHFTQERYCPGFYVNINGVSLCINNPVEQVTWDEAHGFMDGYRLPTEAEREYATRAGTRTRFSYGNDPTCEAINDYGWSYDNSDTGQGRQTHAVAQKKENPWKLFDMHGNVFEWCEDLYADNYGALRESVKDPLNNHTGSYRVFRGGCWRGNPCYLRSALRHHNWPVSRSNLLGFRPVRTKK